MKLIVREYLASLKERGELDAMLPDLLSELGLTVFSKPGRGTRQDGVDVAAIGKLNGGEKKVYLFSIKAGNLTRNNWDGDALQSLRPSLNEIIDSYIPNRLPSKYKDIPKVICLCFGGNIQEQVRPQIVGYIEQNSKDNIEFDEWNGDVLAELILNNFLREELLPKNFQSLFRKSLAMLDTPEVSYNYFSKLLDLIAKSKSNKDIEKLTAIRQINICLWILYAWSREANNIESAYLSSELAVLRVWEISKPFLDKKNKTALAIHIAINTIHFTYHQINLCYLGKIAPHVNKLHAISSAIRTSNKIDLNLKLFDILGRIAIGGIFTYFQFKVIDKFTNNNKELKLCIKKEIALYSVIIKQLINNNPILFTPYKDDQAIDIAITIIFFLLSEKDHEFIHSWLGELLVRIKFNFDAHSNYPCMLTYYKDLIEHPREKTEEYRKKVTASSILYPTIAIAAALYNFDDIFDKIKTMKKNDLKHCSFQLWYPEEGSEESFYINSNIHGGVLVDLCIENGKDIFKERIFEECENSNSFYKLSAMKHGFWPIIFIACRHYRLPIPVHFFKKYYEENEL
jgi:hypothetical protein